MKKHIGMFFMGCRKDIPKILGEPMLKNHAQKSNKFAGRLAKTGAAMLLAAAFVSTAVVPANASGAFNVKLSATGCTEGDYYGTSYSSAGGGAAWANGKTSYRYPICIGSGGIPGVRVFGGGASTAWQYSPGSIVETRVQKGNPAGDANGNHSVGDAHARNT
jgi:hypothetical protein